MKKGIAISLLFGWAAASLAAGTLQAQSTAPAATTAQKPAAQAPPAKKNSASSATSQAAIRGTITDPDGAVVPGALVAIIVDGKPKYSAISKADGSFVLSPVPAGTYTVSVQALSFSTLTQSITLSPAQSLYTNFKLNVETETQQVIVSAQNTNTLDTSPDNNVSAISITGKDLDALSDDPDELQNELTALAGPAAGPNGGQMYVDGFTAGQLPPKSAIREIRINKNPYSAQYDQPGYGRIEILTKPGSDKAHAYVSFMDIPSQLSTSNPFTPNQPSYNTYMFQGSSSGPIGSKASYFVDAMHRDFQDNDVIAAQVLNSSYQPTNYNAALPFVHSHYEIAPRVDVQLTPTNTLSVRYQMYHLSQNNNSVGGLTLASQANSNTYLENTVQVVDTQTIGTKIVNETRFQFNGDISNVTPQLLTPTISVSGGFNGGGFNGGSTRDIENHYELQNYTSIALKNNFIRAGGRLRVWTSNDSTTSGYNGSYTFSSLTDYATAEMAVASSNSGTATLNSSDRFNITYGTPLSTLNYYDLGLYAETDWKVSKNATWSYGGRWESQSGIHDWSDWAPRTSAAWNFDHDKKGNAQYTLRGGFGIFYSRVGTGTLMQANRLSPINGTQRSYSIPGEYVTYFPNVPAESSVSSLSSSTPTYYSLSPNLHASYLMQSSVGLDHRFSDSLSASVNFINSQGRRVSIEEDINAPTPASNYTARPLAAIGGTTNYNLFQDNSEATFNQQQLVANFHYNNAKYGSLGSYYVLNYANGDASGTPSNSYNLKQDYGPTNWDIHQRLYFWGSFYLPFEMVLNPDMAIYSGSPYSITSGNDFNDDSVYNDRPGIASQARISQCMASSSSCFGQVVQADGTYYDVDPAAAYNETLVPINTQRGPVEATFNLNIGKTFGFGPLKDTANGNAPPQGQGGGGRNHNGGYMGSPGHPDPHKYTITMSARANNLFNIADYATPSGVLAPYITTSDTVAPSSQFGVSQALEGANFTGGSSIRRIFLSTAFNF